MGSLLSFDGRFVPFSGGPFLRVFFKKLSISKATLLAYRKKNTVFPLGSCRNALLLHQEIAIAK